MTDRTNRRRAAGVALAAMAMTLAGLAVPTAATAANTVVTVDCLNLPSVDGGRYFPVFAGDTVTFQFIDCDTIDEYDGALSPSTPVNGTPPATVVADLDDGFYVWNSTEPNGAYYWAEIVEGVPEIPPTGMRLATQDFALPPGSAEIDVTEQTPGDAEHFLGGSSTCGIEADPTAAHVYSAVPITITVAGDYTFRGLSSTPAGSYLGAAYDPLEDPFLALYSTWDPSAPDSGVVGCNDDLNDVLGQNDYEITAEGALIEGHQPRFGATLAPGQYTLVLMTWEALGTADLAAGVSAGGDAFPIGARSTSFELWGPAGGLYLGHGAPPSSGNVDDSTTTAALPVPARLPDTGPADIVPAAIFGLLVAGAGTAVVIASRRRGRRIRP